MRHEKIKLTDPNLYQGLIASLEQKREKVWKDSKIWHKDYLILRFNGTDWSRAMSSRCTPTITDAEFLIKYGTPEKWTPRRGDLVEVRDYENEQWMQRIFLAKIARTDYPIICVHPNDEENFKNGKNVDSIRMRFMRPYNPFSLVTKDGVTVDLPLKDVWVISDAQQVCILQARFIKEGQVCFFTKSAAEEHRKKTSREICLEDLDDYIDSQEVWALLNELVTKRLKNGN